MTAEGITPRVALVTGAGRGIGRAVAEGLLADGWTVVAAGRTLAPLQEVVADGTGLAIAADVGDEASVAQLFAEIEERFGRLDLLFNNAGTFGRAAPVTELTLDDWDACIRVNLTGAWLCARAAFALMQRQRPGGGRIINNGSISAQVPRPHSTPYAATKHAITGLTKALSLEGRAHDIAVCQVDIGNAATDMTTGFAAGVLQADGRVAAEPTMSVDNVVATIRYMAGLPLEANAAFVTVMATHMPLLGRG
ncbi:MAG: SDR family oxidoreductase [Nocardioides sp.]